MKDVLVIAYYFPPLGMGGVQRIFKFCKYLPRFGWNPLVVTVKDVTYFSHDPTLLQEATLQIYRTESLDPLRMSHILGVRVLEPSKRTWNRVSSLFLIPDNKVLWLPFLIRIARALQRERQISVLFASSPPHTSLLAGYFLKRLSSVPLVVDLRDPLGYGLYPLTPLHSSILQVLNRKIVEAADRIITAYPLPGFDELRHRPFLIPNGFDPEDFRAPSRPGDRFLIVHTGTLTRKRNGDHFFRALKEFAQLTKVDHQTFRVRLVGWTDPEYLDMIEERGLSQMMELFPYVSHRESVQHLMNASLLWLPAGEGEIPGKVYEYLGSGKHIIATVPKGDCARLIERTH